jgi:hypothetical protein
MVRSPAVPSPVLFRGIVVGRFRFGAMMELGRSGRPMMS